MSAQVLNGGAVASAPVSGSVAVRQDGREGRAVVGTGNRLLAVAQSLLAAHTVSASTGQCEVCVTPAPCEDAAYAITVVRAICPLPRRTPGVALADELMGRSHGFRWLAAAGGKVAEPSAAPS
jgi:hypothetical protein